MQTRGKPSEALTIPCYPRKYPPSRSGMAPDRASIKHWFRSRDETRDS